MLLFFLLWIFGQSHILNVLVTDCFDGLSSRRDAYANILVKIALAVLKVSVVGGYFLR